jgi:hypothetical protein
VRRLFAVCSQVLDLAAVWSSISAYISQMTCLERPGRLRIHQNWLQPILALTDIELVKPPTSCPKTTPFSGGSIPLRSPFFVLPVVFK